ncbi:FAD-dependent oxidoreductase [Nocardioides convexus]|uniref:FAD-dependent oxidoreductase n=1 Tax=Nocardioides convexus TaxID=2712224 RepID=UPI0024182387|nr:FAD-dependent oxidoreductase [Nocardioides convexus]
MSAPTLPRPDHEVVIIGGGFSGIGAAILLARAGFDDYLMLEAGDGVGGAWHWNTYPGVAVDIPSFSLPVLLRAGRRLVTGLRSRARA